MYISLSPHLHPIHISGVGNSLCTLASFTTPSSPSSIIPILMFLFNSSSDFHSSQHIPCILGQTGQYQTTKISLQAGNHYITGTNSGIKKPNSQDIPLYAHAKTVFIQISTSFQFKVIFFFAKYLSSALLYIISFPSLIPIKHVFIVFGLSRMFCALLFIFP